MKFFNTRSIRIKLFAFISILVIIITGTIMSTSSSILIEQLKRERVKTVGTIASNRHKLLITELLSYKKNTENLLDRLIIVCGSHDTKNHFDKNCVLRRIALELKQEQANGAIFRQNNNNETWIIGKIENSNIRPEIFAKDQLAVLKKRDSENIAHPFYVMATDKELSLELFFEYPLTIIQKIFQPLDDLGKSGETFLADNEGFFITQMRYHTHHTNTSNEHAISVNPMKLCLQKNNQESLDQDYRNIPIIHGFRYIPEIGGGCIMAHIDQAEAFAPLTAITQKIIMLALALLIFSIFLIFIFSKQITMPLIYLAEIADSISKDGLHTKSYLQKSHFQRKDEIGVLFNAFNQAIDKLINAKKDIEKNSALNLGIINSSSDIIITTDINGKIENCNRSIELILNYTAHELIGKNIDIIVPMPNLPLFELMLQNATTLYNPANPANPTNLGMELPMKKKDGSTIEVFLKITKIKFNGEIKIIHTVHDLREIKNTQAALQKSEMLFHLALDSMKDYAIILLNPQGFIQNWNKGAEAIKGYKESEIVGKHFSCFYLSDDIINHKPQHNLELAKLYGSYEEEGIRIKKDGQQFLANITITPFYDQNGVHMGFVKITRDITEQRKLQDERLLAKLESKHKSIFLATISHEMRTPLSTIIGISEILMSSPVEKEHRDLIKIAHNAGENLLSIINNTLDLSRVESGLLTIEHIPFLLSEQIKSCISMVSIRATEQNLELTWQIENRVSDYRLGDPTRLRQILLNLLNNAVKFSTEGTISLNVSSIKDEQGDKQGHQKLLFAVTDQGIGIPKDKQHLIFESFTQVDESVTRNYGGSGLGLAITKKLVELMQGKIWVESSPEKGSTFFFSADLPEVDPHTLIVNQENKEIAENKDNQESKNLKILIADDHPENLLIFNLFLKTIHHVYTASNGLEALEMVKKDKFDIIFLDIQMPVMDGYTATKEIRLWEKEQNKKRTPIIACTANAFETDIQESLDAGCDQHLAKPYRKEKLLKIINLYS